MVRKFAIGRGAIRPARKPVTIEYLLRVKRYKLEKAKKERNWELANALEESIKHYEKQLREKQLQKERYVAAPSRVKGYWDIVDKKTSRIIEEGYLSKTEAEYIAEGWKKEFESSDEIGYTNNGNTLVEIYKVGNGWNININSNVRKSKFLARKTNKADALKQALVWMRKHPRG